MTDQEHLFSDIMSEPYLNTPPESVVDASPNLPSQQSVPWPGSTYTITCRKSGRALKLVEGELCLAPHNGEGSVLWACTETDGYLGFRNPTSGCWLGRDPDGKENLRLACKQQHHKGWEFFTVQPHPDGGYYLRHMREDHWWVLLSVGIRKSGNTEELAIFRHEQEGEAVIWDFRRFNVRGHPT